MDETVGCMHKNGVHILVGDNIMVVLGSIRVLKRTWVSGYNKHHP